MHVRGAASPIALAPTRAAGPQAISEPEFDLTPRLKPQRLLQAMLGTCLLGLLLWLTGSWTTASAAVERTIEADRLMVGLAVVAEAASFAGYIVMTRLVIGRVTPRVTVLLSAQLTLAAAAVNRLLPTAGVGGIGLTLWTLRRAGLPGATATSALLTFLVLLYAVFFGALAVVGLIALGDGAGGAPTWLGVASAALGATAIVTGASVGLLGPTRLAARGGRAPGRVRAGAVLLAAGVRSAVLVLRSGDLRLAGALAWWGLDVAVLVAAFAALGETPSVGVIALGYFAGIIANTLPVPGAVSAGMTGVLVLCGVPTDLTLPAVLMYRGISLWLPVPIGALAIFGLKRTTRRWAAEDLAGEDMPPATQQQLTCMTGSSAAIVPNTLTNRVHRTRPQGAHVTCTTSRPASPLAGWHSSRSSPSSSPCSGLGTERR